MTDDEQLQLEHQAEASLQRLLAENQARIELSKKHFDLEIRLRDLTPLLQRLDSHSCDMRPHELKLESQDLLLGEFLTAFQDCVQQLRDAGKCEAWKDVDHEQTFLQNHTTFKGFKRECAEANYHYGRRVLDKLIAGHAVEAEVRNAMQKKSLHESIGYTCCLLLGLGRFGYKLVMKGEELTSTQVGEVAGELPSALIATARGNEGKKPSAEPFIPLTSWNDILAALNEPHGKAFWKNDESTRDKIRKLNNQHIGPIILPKRKGAQPSVDKAVLMEWWSGMREHFDARSDEEQAEAKSEFLTVSDSHNYGPSGKVVPGIGGSEKLRRSKRNEKGKERKR